MNIRIFNIFLIFLIGTAIMIGSAFAEGDSGGNKNTGLSKPNGAPIRAYLNINQISTIFKNTGISDIDVGESNSGLVYPKGSGKTAVFMSGLIWGAYLDSDPIQVRIGGSTYNEGLQGGAILDNGTVEDSDADHVRIYRVRPDVYPDGPDVDVSVEANDEGKSEEAIRTQYELDWTEWPATYGAPYDDVDNSGTYDPAVDIPGVPGANQTIWYVCNDQEPQLTQQLYGTLPLGMEMQLTVWAYSQTGALGNMFFRKYRIINKTDKLGNPQNFNQMYVSMWSDIDIGNSTDDFAGSDTTLSLSYAYNGIAVDPTYTPLPPPAVGFDFFQGPLVDGNAGEDLNKNNVDDALDYGIFNNAVVGPGKINLPMTAAYYFVRGDANVTDPVLGSIEGSDQFYNFMQGKIGLTGEFFVDPTTGQPTTFTLPGDPITGQGWIDGILIGPDDRRIGMASGPFTMAPGDTQEVVVAEICAGSVPGMTAKSAVTLLKFYDIVAQNAYDNFFDLPSPPPAPSVNVVELDEQIVLDWGSNTDRVQQTEGWDVKGYTFQGYNVYQLPSAAATVTEGIRLATYDVIDEVKRVIEDDFNPQTAVILPTVKQFGSDTGIKRFYVIEGDEINGGSPLINGIRYYFAVTAYSYTPDETKIPRSVENPIRIITIVPHSNDPGVTYGDGVGSDVEWTHATGLADGGPEISIVDPTATTGHDYTISFFEQQQIRNANGDWVPAATIMSNGPNDASASTIDISAVYPSTPGTVELQFHFNLVDPDGDWVDGIELIFDPAFSIASVPEVIEAHNGDVVPEVNGNTVVLGLIDDSHTTNGPFTGGEEWSIFVNTFTPPLGVDWVVHDDGWGGNPVNAVGTTTVTEIGFFERTAQLWRVTDNDANQVVIDNISVVNGTDLWPPRDESLTNLGTDAAPVADGIQVSLAVGYAAPLTISQVNAPQLNGDDTYFAYDGGAAWWAGENYTICDFTRFGYADGTVFTSLGPAGYAPGAGGTLEVNQLQQDLEYRFTGVLADSVIAGDTIEVTQSGGQLITIFGASGYSIADHPLNPNPGSTDPFQIRVPFEIWNIDTDEQLNAVMWDRSGDPTVNGGASWNRTNREYIWVVNTPYAETVLDPLSQDVTDHGTWQFVFYESSFTIGDVLRVYYDNPVQFGVDTYTFSTTAPAYSSSLAKSQVNDINVFPNPYYGVNTEELNKYNRFVTFTHLPERANIRIFNLAGVQVAYIEKDEEGQYQRWGLTNDAGLPVASGLYIAYIELPDLGETKILKVAVVQEQQILDRF